MKQWLSIMLLTALLAGCSTEPPKAELVTGTIEEIAAVYIEDFTSQNTENLLNRYAYTKDMKDALTAEMLTSLYAQLESKYGAYLETLDPTRKTSGGYEIIAYLTRWEKADLRINIAFDSEGLIAGLVYNEALEETSVDAAITESEITIGKAPFVLPGTLTLPEGNGPFPALILIHGSGPSDRDESYLELKPFKDIAQYLASKGIAVLRFDKRTFVYPEQLDPETFTAFEESIEDAGFAFELLKNHESVDSENIFIMGHSLGGYLMPRIAAHVPGAAGYIITAGSARPLEEIIIDQYTYIFSLDGTLDDNEKATIDILKTQRDNIQSGKEMPHKDLMNVHHPYWQYLAKYDPLSEILDITQPILILQGEGDYQVTLEDFNLWEDATREMPNVSRKTYPGINHFLYKGEGTPGPDQYGIPGHVDTGLMDDMVSFIKKSTRQ